MDVCFLFKKINFTCCYSHGNQVEISLFGWTINHSKAMRWKIEKERSANSNGGFKIIDLCLTLSLIFLVVFEKSRQWSLIWDSNFIHKYLTSDYELREQTLLSNFPRIGVIIDCVSNHVQSAKLSLFYHHGAYFLKWRRIKNRNGVYLSAISFMLNLHNSLLALKSANCYNFILII